MSDHEETGRSRSGSQPDGERWREPYSALLEIAGSPTYEELVRRWEGFDRESRRFKRATYSYRRAPWGKEWRGNRRLRSDVRDTDLKMAMQALSERVAMNPVFDDPRAYSMRLDLIGAVSVHWNLNPP